jgi:mono/diheme cytochrome c family protein
MTMNWKHLLFGIVVFASVSLLAVAARQDSAPVATQARKASTPKSPAQPLDEGERVFQQNCSRCHTAPDGFSSHISGTIVRHMRVRASLSRDEEKALLRFFNP